MSEHVKRILSIEHVGLKAHDATHTLGTLDVFAGANGAGKSTVLDAHHLLVFGWALGVEKNPQGCMTLARPGAREMTIIERVEMTSGRIRTVERAWKRDRSGSVSQTIHIDGIKMPRREGDAEIAGMFAGLDEAWEPAALFSLPPARMRDRVLRIVPRSGEMSLDRIVPGDCPAWALPKHGDLLPVDWAAFALAQADERIRTTQADIRQAEKRLDEMVVGTEIEAAKEQPTEPIEAKLADLRAEQVAVGARARAERDFEAARVRLAGAESRANGTVRLSELRLLQGKLAATLSADAVESVRRVALARAEASAKRSACDAELLRTHAEVMVAAEEIRHARQKAQAEIDRLAPREKHARAKLAAVPACALSTPEALAKARTAFKPLDDESRLIESRLAEIAEALAALDREAAAQPSLGTWVDGFRAGYALARGFADPAEGDRERDRRIAEAMNPGAAEREAVRLVLTAEQEDKRLDLDVTMGARAEAAQAVHDAELGIKRAEAEREVREVEADMARARAMMVVLPAGVANLGEWLDGIEATASEILSEAEDSEQARRDLPRLRAEMDAAKSALDTLPAASRTAAAIEAEIRAQEAALKAAATHNANAERIREAQESIAAFAEHVETFKGWRERFVGIQENLVRRAKAWLEEKYSELLGGMPVEVTLRDALGNPDCVIKVDGIPVTTLCPGHKAVALVGFVVLLAGIAEGGFRFLPIDELEKVSREYREPFLLAIKSAIDEGALDQVIISGCPDTVPEIEGVTVHRLGAGAVATEAAPAAEEPDDQGEETPPPPRPRRGTPSLVGTSA